MHLKPSRVSHYIYETEHSPSRHITRSFFRTPSIILCHIFWSSSFAFCLIFQVNASKCFASQLFSYTFRSSRIQMVSIQQA